MRPIEGFPDYRIMATGYVVKNDVPIRWWQDTNGYKLVSIINGGKSKMVRVHRLVALSFLGPCPLTHEVNHKDGNKTNNHIDNLEYVTRSQNTRHAWNIGLSVVTHKSRINSAKCGLKRRLLTIEQAETIRDKHSIGIGELALAQEYGVSRRTVYSIVRNHSYGTGKVLTERAKRFKTIVEGEGK
jgi:hypothetical protein